MTRVALSGRVAATGRVSISGRVAIPKVQNLVPRSEEFDNGWTQSGLSVATNTVDTLDPIGGNTAEKITDSSGGTIHRIYRAVTLGIPPQVVGTLLTCSIYFKQGTHRHGAVATDGSGASAAIFDLQTGVVTKQPATTTNIASIENAGNSWWRCWVTSAAVSQSVSVEFWIPNDDGIAFTYTGTANQTLYIWGSQLTWSNHPGPYVKTEASAVNTGRIRWKV